MNTDWTPTLLFAADIGEFAYLIAMIIFGLVSLIAKKATQSKEDSQNGDGGEIFEPAELIEDEPHSPPPPPPIPSQRRTIPSSSRPRPVSPPIAKPATPTTPTAAPVASPRVARNTPVQRPVRATPQTQTPAHPLSQLASALQTAPAARATSRPTPRVQAQEQPCKGTEAHPDHPAPQPPGFESVLGITTQSRSELQRIIVLSEILAPPVALRENGQETGHPSLWG